ncbi:MAG: PucR family transcriptional regulator ligand-binding domain-containing protein [Eubacteriales bacterium]|nr:PucR family transcriptional regulator ligand-binding domain-containing protein [Eubacteriales bacterium]
MAITIKSLIEQTRESYCLRLLTGDIALDYVVTWVHMMEDTSATEFFWGNEMVVTSGYTAQEEASLLRFVDALIDKHCAAVVINIGQYIHTVPQSVIDHCREHALPLLTMPWDMSITEFVRRCCTLITRSTVQEEDLKEALLHIVRSPQDAGHSIQLLSESFHEALGFQMLAIQIGTADAPEKISHHRSMLRLHTALQHYDFPYLVFRHAHRFFLLLNQKDPAIANEIPRRILESMHESFPTLPVQVGIGNPVTAFPSLSESFRGAISAQRCASLQNRKIVFFRDMDFYKLLYSVPDDALLRYYHEKMDPLLEYDRIHSSEYTETLFRYLLTDGSLQAVSSAMYTHRNTINYRMGKIRELLGVEFHSQQDCLPYLLAYHCGRILKIVDDMERI